MGAGAGSLNKASLVDSHDIIVFEDKPFAHGGLRDAYKGYRVRSKKDLTDEKVLGRPRPDYVIKLWRRATTRSEHVLAREDCEVVRVAGTYADAACEFFDRAYSHNPSYVPIRLRFVSCEMARVEAGRAGVGFWRSLVGSTGSIRSPELLRFAVVLVEPYLGSSLRFKKYNSNSGFAVEKKHDCMGAFSHWTWSRSAGQHLVCDVQGVEAGMVSRRWTVHLTDPAIHSLHCGEFGGTDFGILGQVMFFDKHECGPGCAGLALPPTVDEVAAAIGYRPSQVREASGLSYSTDHTSIGRQTQFDVMRSIEDRFRGWYMSAVDRSMRVASRDP